MDMPKLRFKADDGSDFQEWEKISLGEIFTISAGGDLDKSKSTDKQNESFPYPVYSNSLQNNGLFSYASYYKIDGNTFTVTGRGDVGHAIARHEKYVPIVRLLVCKPKFDDNVDFFAEQVNLAKFANESTGVPQLTAPKLKELKVSRPSIAEQHKIADLLLTVDSVIDKQQAEIAAWEQYKKGVAQKLFDQEVRFKADDGSDFPEWKQMSLDEACCINPKTGPLADKFYYMDLNSVDSGHWNAPQLLNKAEAPSRARRVADQDDVFFQSVRPYNMGHYHFTQKRDKQVVASTGFIQARMRNGCNSFLYHLFFENSFNEKINILCTGSSYPAINATEFGKIAVPFPSAPEQRKIAECLDAIDDVIALSKAELEKWRELKKGLLQQLFV